MSPIPSLTHLFAAYSDPPFAGGTDKHTLHSYGPVYDDLFRPQRLTTLRVVEVGILEGYSLIAWLHYFPNATIYGVDRHPMTGRVATGYFRINVVHGDATDPATFDPEWARDLDLVIDDASHRLEDQVRTFEILWPRMSPGGRYVIEDVQNVEVSHATLRLLDPSCQIHDLRHIKQRSDDVLAIFTKMEDDDVSGEVERDGGRAAKVGDRGAGREGVGAERGGGPAERAGSEDQGAGQ